MTEHMANHSFWIVVGLLAGLPVLTGVGHNGGFVLVAIAAALILLRARCGRRSWHAWPSGIAGLMITIAALATLSGVWQPSCPAGAVGGFVGSAGDWSLAMAGLAATGFAILAAQFERRSGSATRDG